MYINAQIHNVAAPDLDRLQNYAQHTCTHRRLRSKRVRDCANFTDPRHWMRACCVTIYVLGHLVLLCQYTVAYYGEPDCLDGWAVVSGSQCSRNAPGSVPILARDAADLLAQYKLKSNLHDSVAGGAAMTETVSGGVVSFKGGALAPGVSLNIPATIPSNSSWTLSLWVKFTDTNSQKIIYSMGTPASYLDLYMRGSTARIVSESGPRQITNTLISGDIDDSQIIFRDNIGNGRHGWRLRQDEWWHYAISASNSIVTEYFNGRERSSRVVDGTYAMAPPAGILGSRLPSSTTSAAFMDFRIYRAALRASEISQLAFWGCDAGLYDSGIDTAAMAKSLALVPSVSPAQFASRGTRTLTPTITSSSSYQLENMPTLFPTGGPDGVTVLSFSQATTNQYVDAGRYTFNLRSNGGFTAVAVVRHTQQPPTSNRMTIFKFHEDELSRIELSISGGTRLVFDISNGNLAPCSVSSDSLMLSQLWLVIIMTYTHNDQTMRLEVRNTTDTYSSFFTCPMLRTDREVTSTSVAFPGLNSVGFHGDVAGLFAVDRVLTPMAIGGIVARMRAGKDTLDPCIFCRLGNVTTTIACSGACGCSPTAASDNSHEGVIVNGPGHYQQGDVCTWIITSTASILAIVTARVGLGNAESENIITPFVCGFDQGLQCIEHARLQTLKEFTITPNTLAPVAGWKANASGSVQILRIQFRATDTKQNGAHFALHWKAFGDRIDCIAPCPAGSRLVLVDRLCVPCGAGTFILVPGHASTCIQCPTGTYKIQPGPGQCTPCQVGAYTAATGAVSAVSCIACGHGTQLRSDRAGCEPCPSSYSARVLSNVLHGIGPMPACIQFVGA